MAIKQQLEMLFGANSDIAGRIHRRRCISLHDVEDACQTVAVRLLSCDKKLPQLTFRYFESCVLRAVSEKFRKRKRSVAHYDFQDEQNHSLLVHTGNHIEKVDARDEWDFRCEGLSIDNRELALRRFGLGEELQSLANDWQVSLPTMSRRCSRLQEYLAARIA